MRLPISLAAGALLVALGASGEPGEAGVITIVGSVPQILALQFHSDALVGDGVVGNQLAGAGTRLNYTLDLGSVVPVQESPAAFRGGTVTLILRSNTNYVLVATVSATGFVADPNFIQLSDIGFGIPEGGIAPSGPLASKDNVSISPGIDADPFTATISDGVPTFAATLKDLGNGLPLLGGGPISHRGSASAPGNGLLVPTRYAVYPQLFRRQETFSATVTYTLSAP